MDKLVSGHLVSIRCFILRFRLLTHWCSLGGMQATIVGRRLRPHRAASHNHIAYLAVPQARCASFSLLYFLYIINSNLSGACTQYARVACSAVAVFYNLAKLLVPRQHGPAAIAPAACSAAPEILTRFLAFPGAGL